MISTISVLYKETEQTNRGGAAAVDHIKPYSRGYDVTTQYTI